MRSAPRNGHAGAAGLLHPLPRHDRGRATNIVQCVGCERWLLVRDHYSRRLAAYMGVMVDAEVPGRIASGQRGIRVSDAQTIAVEVIASSR
jgi:hypothetical protein